MKLIIDIDEQHFELLQMAVMNGMGDNAQKIIAQGIPIPDNATNGAVIKAMFPDTSLHIDERSHTVWVGYEEMSFRKDWWNAPYQKGGKE